ncbi:isoprenylcysteine carboxylmethyltransferase family protein [Rhodobacterales bacterium HKCCE3408]|nr:isoprenylcysteine carboxylmethyltransferase family protein [Rhodobacterales bacterium HKCCE3408]
MALAWLFARYLPLVTVAGPVLRAVGIVIALAGVVLIGWSAYWFRRRRTKIEPHHDPLALIVEGPFRLSRNPIYLGMLAILTGQVLWLGALPGLLLPPLFFDILTRRFVLPEEARLRDGFGPAARRYMERTRRWL